MENKDIEKEYLRKYKSEIEMIYYLINRFPAGITKTRLLKLLYLIDFRSKEKLGKKITKFTYDYYYYGPYSESFIKTLNFSKGYEVTETTKVTSNLEVIYLYTPGMQPRVSAQLSSLNKTQKKIIEEVIDQYGQLEFKELLGEVYKTRPIERKHFGTKNIL